MITETFPTIYSTSASGQQRKWKIYVTDSPSIVIEHGLVGGAIARSERLIRGKNIGKRNETTGHEQAVSEAAARWKKYNDSQERALPMLAHDYAKRAHDIVFPCFVQPKLDGIRAVYDPRQKKLVSRRGETFPHVDHILQELLPCALALDGELYSDTLNFQELNGLLRKETLGARDSERLEQITYHVFDCIQPHPYQARLACLQELSPRAHIQLVETKECHTDAEARQFLERYVASGYEGLILRNKAGAYTANKRSKDLQKFKMFQDAEFTIVGFQAARGTEEGAVIWECATEQGVRFSVRPRGSVDERRALYARGPDFIGARLNVRFQNYSPEGCPIFPVGIYIRYQNIQNEEQDL